MHTSYQPDREYRDGALVDRNVGTKAHALLQASPAGYLRGRRKQWKLEIYISLRVRIAEGLYRIPDVCACREPGPAERCPEKPPLPWVEILHPEDRMADVWGKAKDLIGNGVPYVWIINPETSSP